MTPPFVDVEHIRRQAPGGSYERGVAYFHDGAVRTVSWDPDSSVIDSVVDGSGAQHLSMPHPPRHRATGSADRRRRSARARSSRTASTPSPRCSRAIGSPMPHLAVRVRTDSWRQLLAPPADTEPARPATALALGIELRQRVRRSASRWAPVRVESATPRGLHQFGSDVLLGLRPLERSARSDGWIKGTVSWDVLRRAGNVYEPGAGALVHRAVQHRPRHAPVRLLLGRIGLAHPRRHRIPSALASARDSGRSRHRPGADQEEHERRRGAGCSDRRPRGAHVRGARTHGPRLDRRRGRRRRRGSPDRPHRRLPFRGAAANGSS